MKHFKLTILFIVFLSLSTSYQESAHAGVPVLLGFKLYKAYKAHKAAKAARAAINAKNAQRAYLAAKKAGLTSNQARTEVARRIEVARNYALRKAREAHLATLEAKKEGVEAALENIYDFLKNARNKYPSLNTTNQREHIIAAYAAIDKGNLIFNDKVPGIASAFQHLLVILESDPKNKEALNILDKIAATYQNWAKRSIANGDYEKADEHLRISKSIIDQYHFNNRYTEQARLMVNLSSLIQPEGSKECITNDNLHHKAKRGGINALDDIAKCLNAGVPVDIRESNSPGNGRLPNNWTPLISASAGGNIEIAKLLIDNCADINAKDYFGRTSLDHAIANKKNEMTKYLKSLGALKRGEALQPDRPANQCQTIIAQQ